MYPFVRFIVARSHDIRGRPGSRTPVVQAVRRSAVLTILRPRASLSLNRHSHQLNFVYPASHPATPAPFGASPGPVALTVALLGPLTTTPAYCPDACPPQFLGGRHQAPCPDCPNYTPGYIPGFGGFSFHPHPLSARRRGCSCACLPFAVWVVHFVRLGCLPAWTQRRPWWFSCTRAQSRPRSLSQTPVFPVLWFMVVVVNLDPPALVGLSLQRFGTRPKLTTPRPNWTILEPAPGIEPRQSASAGWGCGLFHRIPGGVNLHNRGPYCPGKIL